MHSSNLIAGAFLALLSTATALPAVAAPGAPACKNPPKRVEW
jgi:hypothetical protein